MCLDKKRFQIYKIANKDLYTIKFLNDGLKSPFQEFLYELNKTYSILTTLWWGYFSKQITRGYHSINGNYYLDEDIIVVCKIPKGSKYYLGNDGDVVSNKIELIEIIKEETNLNKTSQFNRLIKGMKYIYEIYPDNNLILDDFKKFIR